MFSLLSCLLLPLAQTDARITAAEVTFPQVEMTLRQAVEVLNRTGNRVVDYRGRQGQEVTNPRVKLSTQPQRFWAAVDAVAQHAHLRVVPFAERNGASVVGLLARPEGTAASPLMVQYEGPFRIALVKMTAVRTFEEEVEPSRLLVTMQVAWEPRYRPLWCNLPVNTVQLANGDGKWQPVPQLQTQSFRAADEAAVTFTVQLPLPPRTRAVLPELLLKATLLIPPRQTPFLFPTLKEGQKKQGDGVTCTLTRIEANRQGRTWITMRLNYPENVLDLESHQGWVMQANTLTLIPKNGGQPLCFTTAMAEIDIKEHSGIDIRHRLDNLPQPLQEYQLRYEAPAPPAKYLLELRLKNVPLP